MRRRICALAVSFALHLLALIVALVHSSASRGPRTNASAPLPPSMSVFAAPRSDDNAPPGLNALDPGDDDDFIHRSRGSATVSLPEFTVNIAKIAERATLLFPFL